MSTSIGKLKISQCPGFPREYYVCPENGQFGLHDYHGGHICDNCEYCASITNYPSRVEIRCCYPKTAEECLSDLRPGYEQLKLKL